MSILKKHFPMIRDREDVINEISSNSNLKSIFDTWNTEQQERFLDYCTGERGIKICYDAYFKEIFNVEYDKSRLDDLLSSIMGEKIEIISVLPNEGARISSENNLLLTDILVRLENGSLVNVEIQKIGYTFPGARVSCYSADLLLREYKRIRDKNRKHFSYKDIMPVYTVVIFEQSPKELREAKKHYIHKSKTVFDTGIKVNLLQNFIFISLDNFRDILQNRIEESRNRLDGDSLSSDSGNFSSDEENLSGDEDNLSSNSGNLSSDRENLSGNELLHNRLEEWLMFLSVDEPELIELLLRHRPSFGDLYSDIYDMCLNTERLMNMYSKVLSEFDKNTVVYMIDELKAEIDSQKSELDKKEAEIDSQKAEIDNQKAEISKKDKSLAEKDNTIAELTRQLEELKSQK